MTTKKASFSLPRYKSVVEMDWCILLGTIGDAFSEHSSNNGEELYCW